MFDSFGELDPRKMPSHLFSGALHLDYSTAIEADISKQAYSVCPRHWYIDAAFRCARCDNTFVFSAEEQRFWYEELGFYIDSQAKHCGNCRLELRQLKSLRQEYDREIAAALASDAGLEQKKRVMAAVDALDRGGVKLPEKIQENRRILARQVERIERSGAA
ncbi:MAG TPA: zinc-ribbon domain containing protein [Humisphaera sp.]|nr:zinc-ribbon domain containing protein [Humisphaera sp.]